MKSLTELQTRVAAWSRKNFGDQVSKFDGNTYGHILPLLGVAEEYFEGKVAFNRTDYAEEMDALADQVIYICDFSHRLGILLHDDWSTYHHDSNRSFMNLFHATLKMHQGIRGYEDQEYALKEISHSLHSVICSLNERFGRIAPTAYLGKTIINLTTDTFDKIVSKRDWVADPTGGEATT